MNEIEILDAVLLLARKQREAENAIRETKYKRVGSYLMALTDDEKNRRIDTMRREYRREIGKLYNQLNEGRISSGHEPLENPFI